MLSQSPDGPLESLGVSAKGTSRWRSGQSRQTMESTLPAEPEPQWNAGKPRGPTGKRAVPPSRTSPDSNDASQRTSDGGSKVRARRSNRQHKKRGEDSFELQRLEESRTEKRERGGAKKDDNRTISKPANMKSSTTGKKAKVQKGSAQIRAAEDDEDKWTEEELAILQEYVWFPKNHNGPVPSDRIRLQCVCVFYPGPFRSILNTRPTTGRRWRGLWEHALRKTVTTSTLSREPRSLRSPRRRRGKRNSRKHQGARVGGGLPHSMTSIWFIQPWS